MIQTKTSAIVILPNGQKATLTATAKRSQIGFDRDGVTRLFGWDVKFEGRETGSHSIFLDYDSEAPLLAQRVLAHWEGYQEGCETHGADGVLLDWREQWATERAEVHAALVKDARRDGLPVVTSRGREWVLGLGGSMTGEPLYGAKLTHKSLREALTAAQAHGAENIELREGFNGSASVRDLVDGQYAPWIGCASMIVWRREWVAKDV